MPTLFKCTFVVCFLSWRVLCLRKCRRFVGRGLLVGVFLFWVDGWNCCRCRDFCSWVFCMDSRFRPWGLGWRRGSCRSLGLCLALITLCQGRLYLHIYIYIYNEIHWVQDRPQEIFIRLMLQISFVWQKVATLVSQFKEWPILPDECGHLLPYETDL